MSFDDASTDEAPVAETEVAPDTQAEPSGGNPAWDSLRAELDPISFSRIEPHLKSMDSAAQQRITAQNDEYRWAKDIQSQNIAPDRVQAALQFADVLDNNPEGLYEQLGQFLRDNGRMPESKQELVDNVVANEEQDQNQQQQEDPRFAQLTEQSQRIENFLMQQEQERLNTAADTQVRSEIQQLEASRADLQRADIAEILGRAANNNESLAAATQWFDSMKTRFLSAPRPGDSAPQLLPTSGGVSTASAGKTAGKMTSDEIQSMIAGSIISSRG